MTYSAPLTVGRIDMRLPQKLGKVPLVEAIFEVRFKARTAASSVLPGLIFSKYPGEKKIERLPMSEMHEAFRSVDPNFRYAPLVRVHWDTFMISAGDRSVSLASKLPYPGWTVYKTAIVNLVRLVDESAIVESVERFSLKYTNIIPYEIGSAPSVAEFALKIGSHDASNHLFQIRAEFPNKSLICVVQIASEGLATLLDGTTRKGVVIDLDTIAMIDDLPFSKFANVLEERVEETHSEAKKMFFGCLKPEALEKLEPIYE
jgi:uncharacterized protein (TIGR04255 family)